MAIETRYDVNMHIVRDIITSTSVGATILLGCDSTWSVEASQRMNEMLIAEWAFPNGIAGMFMPCAVAATGVLSQFDGTGGGVDSSYMYASLPAAAGDFDRYAWAELIGSRDFNVTNIDGVWNGLTGLNAASVGGSVKASIVGHSVNYVTDGTLSGFQGFHNIYLGPQGNSAIGTLCAAGDWLTGADDVRLGLVYEPTADTIPDAITLQTREGFENPGIQATVTQTVTLSTTPNSPQAPKIAWSTTLASSSLSTPWGTAPTANELPIVSQYEWYGTVDAGEAMTNSDLVYAGPADYTGVFRILWNRENSAITANTRLLYYGTLIQRQNRPLGAFIIPMSFPGVSTRFLLDQCTTLQLANTLNLVPGRPVNLVVIALGYNFTSAENGGAVAYVKSEYKRNIVEQITRYRAAADLAGVPHPKFLLVSQPEGLQYGSTGHRTVSAPDAEIKQAEALREIARADPNVAFVDLYQFTMDRWPAEKSRYDMNRTNEYWNIQQDGIHPSATGARAYQRFIWSRIMGATNPSTVSAGGSRSDRRGLN